MRKDSDFLESARKKEERSKGQIASRDSRRPACHFARENVRVKMAGIFLGHNSADVAAWLNFDEWKERNHGCSFVPERVQDIGPLPYFLIWRSVSVALFTIEVRDDARSYR